MTGATPAGLTGTDTGPRARGGRGPDVGWATALWGVALLAVGTVWLLDRTDVLAVSYASVFGVALIAAGAAVAVVPATDRGAVVGLGLTLFVAAVLALVPWTRFDPTVVRHGVGEVTVRPASVAALDDRYEHGIGQLTVDLRDVDPTTGAATVIRLGIGELDIRVPDDATVRFVGNVGLGEVVGPSRERAGAGVELTERTRGPSAERVLRIDASVAVGRIAVTR